MPLKSLHRFKCVHKSWSILFENSYFMNMYRKYFISDNSYYDDAYLLLKQTILDNENHSLLYLLYGERFDNKVKLDWPPSFREDDRDINIVGSGINGILCLYVEGFSSKVVLWNLAIEEFKVIPSGPVLFVPPYVKVMNQIHGFGYYYIRDDYKVIRYVDFHTNMSKVSYDPSWEIYSLKSNFWRKLDLDMTTFYYCLAGVLEQVYMDGMCHWLGRDETNIDNVYLVSFDLSNEVFFLTSILFNYG